MASLPPYAVVLFDGYGEQFDPSVERTEMERGIPKQRIQNTGVLQEISVDLLFKSAADAASFEDWYFDTIKRIGFFDVIHPRTGVTHSMRFKGGDIGRLVPRMPTFAWSQRSVVLEYMR